MQGEATEDQEMSGDDLAMAQKCRLHIYEFPSLRRTSSRRG